MPSSTPIKPLLPVKNRIDSFWLTERDIELKAFRSTTNLPSTADVVIVGSGLSGAMSCYHIYRQTKEQGRRINVVMLEADETCGSATARNGTSRCMSSWVFTDPQAAIASQSLS